MRQKKWLALVLCVIMAVSIFSGCGGQKDPETQTPENQENGQSGESTLSIKNAQNFNIEYMADGVKLVTDSDGRELLLVPEGVEAPSGYESAVQIATPIKSAMYTSTTHVGYIGALEEASLYDSIAAVCTPESDWTLPEVLERFKSGQITYIAQDHWTAGDIEEVVSVNPQIVFSGGGDESGVALRALLDEVGIDYAVVTEWTESSNAATLEWIKFFAAFFNLDKEADAIYEEKLARMEELYAMTSGIAEADRPTVAYGLVYDGIVYTQAGNSTLAQEIEKAGGVYALKDLEGDGSVQLGMEEFLDKCKDADILLYGSLPQYMPDADFLLETEPLFSEFKAFQNNQVYIFDQGYYMNSAKVVEKFEDLVAICQPDLIANHSFSMYQLLPTAAEAAA